MRGRKRDAAALSCRRKPSPPLPLYKISLPIQINSVLFLNRFSHCFKCLLGPIVSHGTKHLAGLPICWKEPGSHRGGQGWNQRAPAWCHHASFLERCQRCKGSSSTHLWLIVFHETLFQFHFLCAFIITNNVLCRHQSVLKWVQKSFLVLTQCLHLEKRLGQVYGSLSCGLCLLMLLYFFFFSYCVLIKILIWGFMVSLLLYKSYCNYA